MILQRAVQAALPALLTTVLVGGCASAPAAGEGLDAVLWAQTSAEYRSVAQQAYTAAARQLEMALRDSSWTASLEQEAGFDTLPPAVILDIDETVLDNFPYQARLVRTGERFEQESWALWVREAAAEAVPGALAFARAAADRGVALFYVSNRSADLEEPTRANLERLGFPVPDTEDRILLEDEREGWGPDKTSRRAFVARRYRILLLAGDDLRDFLWVGPVAPDARVALADRYRDWWGTHWIVLPNPTYGSWERAVYGHDLSLDAVERLERKRAGLDPRAGVGGET